MKKPQGRKSEHSSALDKLCARYEDRGRSYNGTKESGEQEMCEIRSRTISPSSYRLSLNDSTRTARKNMTDGDFVDYCTSSRERMPTPDAETDTRLVLERIDRERYKKVSPKQTETKKTDVGATLRKRAGGDLRVKPDAPRPDPQKRSGERAGTAKKAPDVVKNAPKREKSERAERKKLPITALIAIGAVGVSLILIIISIILLFP